MAWLQERQTGVWFQPAHHLLNGQILQTQRPRRFLAFQDALIVALLLLLAVSSLLMGNEFAGHYDQARLPADGGVNALRLGVREEPDVAEFLGKP